MGVGGMVDANTALHLWTWVVMLWCAAYVPSRATPVGLPSCSGPQGTEFIMAFMQNFLPRFGKADFKLFITTYMPNTTITVSVNKEDFSFQAIANLGETVVVKIPEFVELLRSGTSHRTVIIQADQEVSVFALNYKRNTADTTIVYPVKDLGTEYYVVTPKEGLSELYKQFAVVSGQESTRVDIHLKGAVTFQERTYPAGSNLTIILEAYQAVQLQSRDDLSSTRIVSQNPVAVYAGHVCASKHTKCDYVGEQLLPVSKWGTTFVVPVMSFQTKFDLAYVVASQDTHISYHSGSLKASMILAPGQVMTFEVTVSNPLYLSASVGVQVVVFCTGGTHKNLIYDPFLMTIPDVSSYCKTYSIFGQEKFENYALIVAKTSDTTALTIDKQPLRFTLWRPVPGAAYSWTLYRLGMGYSNHTIEHPSSPFVVLSIGISDKSGYGSPAIGGRGSPVSPTITPAEPPHTTCSGPQGNEFIMAFLQNYVPSYGQSRNMLFITSYFPDTSVTVLVNQANFTVHLTGNPSETIPVSIPAFAELQGSTISDNTVTIRADQQISVLALNYKDHTADTTVIYPIQDLGTDYYVVTPRRLSKIGYKQFMVVTWQESTRVDIYLRGDVTFQRQIYTAGRQLTITLEAYQAIQLQSHDDLSGTRIVSQSPVAVYAGHTCASKHTKCDYVGEQLLPVSTWGTTFVVPAMSFQTKFDVVYVVASQDTHITYHSRLREATKHLEAGQVTVFEITALRPLYLSASVGIQVVFFSTGGTSRNIIYDPFFMTIPDVSSYCQTYNVFGQEDFENYALIVVNTSQSEGIILDNRPLRNLKWKPVPGTEFSWAEYNLGRGFKRHNMRHLSTSFGLWNIGINDKSGYGSPAIGIRDTLMPSCSVVHCRAGTFCRMRDGQPECVPLSEATCWAMGYLHFQTFDGWTYDMRGICTYMVAQSCGEASNLPAFNVTATTDSRGNSLISYITSLTVQVYGVKVTVVRSEVGFVRVNGARAHLPLSLHHRALLLSQAGSHLLLVTDFGLRVSYDWHHHLRLHIPSTFSAHLCGLCGNYNGDPADDLPDAPTLAQSWPLGDSNQLCWHDCFGTCGSCTQKQSLAYAGEAWCGLMAKAGEGPFSPCHARVNPEVYAYNCMADLCHHNGYREVLCEALAAYATACQLLGVSIGDWRELARCSLECPQENSQYQLCGTACPATCVNEDDPSSCPFPCMETCQCKAGYVLSQGRCVPTSGCGCMFEGRPYAPVGRTPHYITFDRQRYNFQGTCRYQLAALCQGAEGLVSFHIDIQEQSEMAPVQVRVYETNIQINLRFPGKALVNGFLFNLPFNLDANKISIYRRGWAMVIQTDFGLTVTFTEWSGRTAITLPSTYMGAVCGLCGNFNGDAEDDFLMSDGHLASNPTSLGQSWTVGGTSGCSVVRIQPQPDQEALKQQQYSTKGQCQVILDKSGPFRMCHSKVDPQGYFSDCVYDYYLQQGQQDIICQAVASYVAACQEAGAMVYPWRTQKFCPPSCPPNSHYETCSKGCDLSCGHLYSPTQCTAGCMEGCMCNEGFPLSGNHCITLSQCGCLHKGLYYQAGEIFYPEASCKKQCECRPGGDVRCQEHTCRAGEDCLTVDGIRRCYPLRSASCLATGLSHYLSFDGLSFDFQGTCTYTLVKTCTLTGKLMPFVVTLEKEITGHGKVSVAKTVSVEVYGIVLTLLPHSWGSIRVDGVSHNLPVMMADGRLRAYQHGLNVLVKTDFGLAVSYDFLYRVGVTVSGGYRGHVCGLCGNYNGRQDDEFLLPNGTMAPNTPMFGAFWKGPMSEPSCEAGMQAPVCKETEQKTSSCELITASNGPFASCHSVIRPSAYLSHCIHDLCLSDRDPQVLCQSIHSYMIACQSARVPIEEWRNESFCPLSCPANSHYQICSSLCSTSCASLTSDLQCPDICAEGCQCDDGFFFDGQGCVAARSCGCFQNGIYYKPNEKLLRNKCKEICTCVPTRGVTCEAPGCPEGETCGIKNGLQSCIGKDLRCREKESYKSEDGHAKCVPDYMRTCRAWGNSHFYTLDGLDFAFQGTCTYTLVKSCGSDAGLVPFAVEEKNDNRGCPATSSVRFTNIHVYGHNISIHKGEVGKIRLNGVVTNLPITLEGGEIRMYQSSFRAVLRTAFGLQVAYDWNWLLEVTVPSSYYGATCGLCGNFNQDPNDDLTLLDGSVVPSIISWAALSCPENSHYEACGNACPATCSDPAAPSSCWEPCEESCQCDPGYILSAGRCILVDSCDCSYGGQFYEPGKIFWTDENCRAQCMCDPSLGVVLCKEVSCKSNEKCTLVNGHWGCHASSYSTCMATGDAHYTTFDGKKYDITGTCTYQFAALCSKDPTLVPFLITVQNSHRGLRATSFIQSVTLDVYNVTITLSWEHPHKIQVDGVLVDLPFHHKDKLSVYLSGRHGFVKTEFDLQVTFDWFSSAQVVLPNLYAGATCGLCGNANGDPSDDLTMKDGSSAFNEAQFTESWKLRGLPGCSARCSGSCVVCTEAQKLPYKAEYYCGVLMGEDGPFRQCHETITLAPFFDHCILDTCQFKGYHDILCNSISAYVTACQAQGIAVGPWRSAMFCDLPCPPHSHYELCGNSCPTTCHGLVSLEMCDAPCTEGCFCDAGFVLSGDRCVPAEECGCVHQGRYYSQGAEFYVDISCQKWCRCTTNGVIECSLVSCSTHEECRLENGIFGCHPVASGTCVAHAGTHYLTFDGQAFNFQGSCGYIMAEAKEGDSRLENFSVVIENDVSIGDSLLPPGRTVVVTAHGHTMTIEKGKKWRIMVDEELYILPLTLDDGKLWANQEGNNIIIQAASGFRVLYDTSSYVLVTVPSTYQGRMRGLCGNYNGDKSDDFLLPTGRGTKDMDEFITSWKVHVDDPRCTKGCGVQCPVCSTNKMAPYQVGSSCGQMRDTLGPFSDCHNLVSPASYFKSCVQDMCATRGAQETLCHSLQAYTAACQLVGAQVRDWRSDAFCPLSCPPHSHYEMCTRSCDFTCAALSVPTHCTERCFEGCQCDDGYLFDGASCVPLYQCGCVRDGRYLQIGESIMSSNCSQTCACRSAGELVCERSQGCVDQEGHCTWASGGWFTSFDGVSGKAPSDGAYDMVSLCEGSSLPWFRLVTKVLREGGIPVPGAIYLFFEEGLVVISKTREVWVNGRSTQLPVQVSETVSVSESQGTITITQAAGVQVQLSSNGEVTVMVKKTLANQLCAACGDFNGNASNDLQLPSGKIVGTITEIIDSWKARDFPRSGNEGSLEMQGKTSLLHGLYPGA
ncbi:hypothetical protein Y1Q_0021924 [Alligator mississippiensis]|uniref:VWFD domain-containing protein n=1 Tax=Alligator mississippiensis TaxID=8496 RepID=A0A151MJS8_ALLMI|nr:hypothetical protein Y1Q_0021924 [Alligator mississippiensis]